jgi:hypothetical protein
MEKERISNHIKISVVCLLVSYLLSSYAFGSFNPNDGTYDDRVMTVIISVIGTIIANFLYHESYTKEENKNN